jgi:hypothetical protein
MLFSKKLFLERYSDLHNRIFPTLIESQPEEKLRRQKDDENPIIWIYWHIVRAEDIGLNRFILNKENNL